MKIKLTRNKIITGIVTLVVIVSAYAGYFSYYKSDGNGSGKDAPTVEEPVSVRAAEKANTGDIDGALQYYEEKIQAEKDDNKKLDLLLGKTSIAYSHGRYDEALNAAKDAEAINSDASLVTLAKLYEAKGDKVKAREYYQRILDKAGVDGREGDRWLRKVREMSS